MEKKTRSAENKRKRTAYKYNGSGKFGEDSEIHDSRELYGNAVKRMPKKVWFGVIAAVAAVLLFLALNEAVFHIEGIPTLKEVFTVTENREGQSDIPINKSNLEAHFIDVGQGDCELLICGGKTALIDCGERDYYEQVIKYIADLGIEKLDYVIVSHPHTDHMGGMSYILDRFEIGTVIMPKLREEVLPTTNSYTRLLKSIANKDIKVDYAKPGTSFPLGDTELQVLAPAGEYNDLNNSSAVIRAVHGENTFMFTGDIEKLAETDILNTGAELSSDVLKIAHHGSSSSSSEAFLEAVNPKYAVIEVGKGNDYGHPHKDTIKLLDKMKVNVYRTDKSGTIVFTSMIDGGIEISEKG